MKINYEALIICGLVTISLWAGATLGYIAGYQKASEYYESKIEQIERNNYNADKK